VRVLPSLALATSLWSLGACRQPPIELAPDFPQVPLPDFAMAVETHSRHPQRLERFFVPEMQHALGEVRAFYGEWAENANWRKVEPSEESWSIDAWQEFGVGEERVRQYLVHWTDPGNQWSLRLAMRFYLETGKAGVWVVVEPYYNLDDVPIPTPSAS